MKHCRLDDSTRWKNLRWIEAAIFDPRPFYVCISMPHIPCYQSGVIVNCAPVSVASENRSLSMWVGHFLKASSVVEESCSQRRTKLFRNQLKQRNCPEISHQKNCRGHNIKRTLHRRDQNQSPSNISSKCGRISSLRRAKRSLPNTKLSNFEVQHSIIQLGNVFCPKTSLPRQFTYIRPNRFCQRSKMATETQELS